MVIIWWSQYKVIHGDYMVIIWWSQYKVIHASVNSSQILKIYVCVSISILLEIILHGPKSFFLSKEAE